MAEVKIPQAFSFTWDVIEAIRSLGGSGSIQEINDAVVQRRGLTEEQQAVTHSDGRTEIEYRLAWARTLAKNLGLVVNSARGVWAVTPLGASASEEEVEELKRGRDRGRGARQRAELASAAEAGVGPVDASDVIDPDDVDEGADSPTDWREELLAVVKAMDPGAFERLAQRLLREAGFTSVVVMGKSGDGGIDGRGVYRVSPLLSFPAYFQCKRYAGSVGAGEVRDFRGAMTGRGDKGLFITTGTFTADAKREATRDGAPPLDLIDGEQLVELLREFNVGVQSVERIEYDVTIDQHYFATL